MRVARLADQSNGERLANEESAITIGCNGGRELVVLKWSVNFAAPLNRHVTATDP